VPITQLRMQNVLAECQSLVAHLEQLREDADRVARSAWNEKAQVALILKLLYEPRPATPHSEREREHFQKAARRNADQAKRMRRLRAKQQEDEHHGLD